MDGHGSIFCPEWGENRLWWRKKGVKIIFRLFLTFIIDLIMVREGKRQTNLGEWRHLEGWLQGFPYGQAYYSDVIKTEFLWQKKRCCCLSGRRKTIRIDNLCRRIENAIP